jgi:ATP-dependent RNA helicase DeaD
MTFPVSNPAFAQALAARGYSEPTSVQSAVLQADAEGRDLLVSAQTGSGKTVAFGLALGATILGEAETLPSTHAPLALVIAPTRELALQVHAELSWLYAPAGGRIVSCVGGMDWRREARHLAAGCHIVVGTPGRLKDHIDRGNVNLSEIETLVLDEADEMLDLGFQEELDFILAATPAGRRTLLFSATISREIAAMARTYQTNALRIDTVSRTEPHADIDYRAVLAGPHEGEAALVNLLRMQDTRALVFCSTREGVKHLHASLLARGFGAVALSGELSQGERTAALNALREGRAQVCIATDVAARGLDLPDLALVIHADLPTNKATLLHRSGRTGRAGKKGVCLLLVSPMKKRRAEMLLASANISATWVTPPTADEVRARDAERLLDHPLLSQTPEGEERRAALTLLERYAPEAVAAAFVRLAQVHLPEPASITVLSITAPPRAPRPVTEGGSWFSVPLGRKQNADPRWLIPLICTRGGVSKADIGAIRIFDRETKFEIASSALAGFTTASAQTPPGEAPIEPATPPSPGRPAAPRTGPRPAPHTAPRRDTPPGGELNEQQRRRKNKAGKGPR